MTRFRNGTDMSLFLFFQQKTYRFNFTFPVKKKIEIVIYTKIKLK